MQQRTLVALECEARHADQALETNQYKKSEGRPRLLHLLCECTSLAGHGITHLQPTLEAECPREGPHEGNTPESGDGGVIQGAMQQHI